MAKETDIPLPVRFNPFKHHRNYILSVLESSTPEMIINLLDQVCNNYIDIYTGAMTPEAISEAVIEILKSNQVFREDDFSPWVDSKNGYRQIKLADRSVWVVRKSNEVERYIHLHPAREGPFTIRFKGSTLKTAYILKTNFTSLQESLSLGKVNRARMQISLSPVKKLERGKGILNCYEKFFSQE
ncbi:MAG: hypothetical protein Q8S54_03745 [Bacteroidota bacterium]|nr:hypothetical protein [Odoribacter sp.]MDP3642287.1 hypothetical protein [Bacteroidota bacterium]